MTVSTEVDHNDYTGNGVTTTFPYTFRIFQKSDLVVQVVDLNENLTVLVLDTDYTVTGAGGYTGGNVILTTALANGYQISISRELPVTQDTDLRNQGKFFAEVHEDALDKLTMLIQQVRSWFGLSLRKPTAIANWYDALNNYIRNLRDPRDPQDAATKNYVDTLANDNLNRTLRVPELINQLPAAEERANKIPAFDDAGNAIVIVPPSGSASEVMLLLAAKDGYSYIGELQSVSGFYGLIKQDGARVKLRSWYAGWAGTSYGKPSGGGDFIYQASVPKSKHDGCIYFSPTVPYSTTLSEYVTGTGETDPSGSGVWVRDVNDATHVHTDWAGINDGSTLSGSSAHGDAVQKVFNAAAELGKHVKLGYGAIHIEKAVSMPAFFDNSASMPRIEGYGINSSYLICYPLGTDNYNISCVLPVNFAQSWGLKDFQIREKNLTRTGYLMKLGRITGGLFERIKFSGGYQQLYAMSVLSCTWIECAWFSGFRGAKFEAGGTVGSGYANPNANYFLRAQILSMENQGFWVIGATQFRLQGGSIEGCGSPGDTLFRGVYMQGGGSDGVNGLIADSVYIESCSGYPFYLATSGNRSICHAIRNCNFNNNSAQYPVSQVIMLGSNYAFPSGVTSTLEFTGNNCLSVGYTGSSTRPDVYVDQYSSNNQAVLIEYNNRYITSQSPTVAGTVRVRNSGNAGISGQISTSGTVTAGKNIISATWGSTGACTITANYDLSNTRLSPSVLGSGGFAIVGSVSGNTAVIRVYNATGTATNIAFDIIGLDSSAQFTS